MLIHSMHVALYAFIRDYGGYCYTCVLPLSCTHLIHMLIRSLDFGVYSLLCSFECTYVILRTYIHTYVCTYVYYMFIMVYIHVLYIMVYVRIFMYYFGLYSCSYVIVCTHQCLPALQLPVQCRAV